MANTRKTCKRGWTKIKDGKEEKHVAYMVNLYDIYKKFRGGETAYDTIEKMPKEFREIYDKGEEPEEDMRNIWVYVELIKKIEDVKTVKDVLEKIEKEEDIVEIKFLGNKRFGDCVPTIKDRGFHYFYNLDIKNGKISNSGMKVTDIDKNKLLVKTVKVEYPEEHLYFTKCQIHGRDRQIENYVTIPMYDWEIKNKVEVVLKERKGSKEYTYVYSKEKEKLVEKKN